MKDFAIEICRNAGQLLLESFGNVSSISHKGDISNVVTSADLASENIIAEAIQQTYPTHAILGEESGFTAGTSEYTWVIDPLDGSSNFAAGIPWFGVLLALLKHQTPVMGLMYLPVTDDLYFAEQGAPAVHNDKVISVSKEKELSNVLWNYGMDATHNIDQAEREIRCLGALKNSVRNVRATNSLVDACLTADGRIGGFVNQSVKVWDFAASKIIIEQAGGVVTNLSGAPLSFDFSHPEKNYGILACASQFQEKVLELIGNSASHERAA